MQSNPRGAINLMKNLKIQDSTHSAIKSIASKAGEKLGEYADAVLRRDAKLKPIKKPAKSKP